LIEIENLNSRVEALHERFRALDLPYQLYFQKSGEDIDYSRLKVSIVGLNNSRTITLSDSSIEGKNKLTALTIPALPEGQYMVKIENKRTVDVVQYNGFFNGLFDIETSRSDNFDG